MGIVNIFSNFKLIPFPNICIALVKGGGVKYESKFRTSAVCTLVFECLMTIFSSILMCFREMKIALVLVLCLAAGSQANFLDDLKNAFSNIGTALTTTVHAVGDQAKVVGQNLLTTAKEQGSQLASQALQSERMLNCTQLKRNCFAFRGCFFTQKSKCLLLGIAS